VTTYKELTGVLIKRQTTNPSNAASGDVWYNNTTGNLKSLLFTATTTSQTAMSRGANYNQFGTASGGSADANWAGAGSPGYTNITEEFNGSGWSSGGNQTVSALNRSGFGTLTAGVICGGMLATPVATNATEHYDGSAWSAENAMPEALRGMCGGGPQTAAIMYSGHGNPTYPVASNLTKYYDGTNWSVQPANMNTARANMSGCGTQTAALGVSGEASGTPTAPTMTEEWNGSSWTAVASLNTARSNQGPAMCQGSTTSATLLGGNPSPGTAIENYDGTSWTTSPVSLVNANSQAGGTGSSSGNILKAAGNSQGSVEQYQETTNTFVAAAWASGGALGTARIAGAMGGIQTSAFYAGGRVGPPGGTAVSEEYNGTSWSEGNNLNTPRQYVEGAGTESAGLAAGGYPASGATEEYNGTSWATQPNSMLTARGFGGMSGAQDSAVYAGGTYPSTAVTNLVEEYNGTIWSEQNDLSQARKYTGAVGTGDTVMMVFGGSDQPGSTKYANTEEYDGTNWTAGGSLITARQGLSGSPGATKDSAITAGGYDGSNASASTEGYDGTTWSTRPSLATARYDIRGAGTASLGIVAGGEGPPGIMTNTEEFTAEVATTNIGSFTTS